MLKSPILSLSALSFFALFSINAHSAVGASGSVPWPSQVNQSPCVNTFAWGSAKFSAWEYKSSPWSRSSLRINSSASTRSRYIVERGVGCATDGVYPLASKISIKYRAARILSPTTHYNMASANNSAVNSSYIYAEDNPTYGWNSGLIPGCITSKHSITRNGMTYTSHLQVQNAGPQCFRIWY